MLLLNQGYFQFQNVKNMSYMTTSIKTSEPNFSNKKKVNSKRGYTEAE